MDIVSAIDRESSGPSTVEHLESSLCLVRNQSAFQCRCLAWPRQLAPLGFIRWMGRAKPPATVTMTDFLQAVKEVSGMAFYLAHTVSRLSASEG